MSGGFFDFQEIWLDEMAGAIRVQLALARKGIYDYPEEFIREMHETHDALKRLGCVVRRMDRVFSNDDGPDGYFARLPVDLEIVRWDDPAEDEAYIEKDKFHGYDNGRMR